MSHESPPVSLLSDEAEKHYQEVKADRREKRAALLKRLEDEGAEDLAKRLRKCGQKLQLHCVDCGKVKEVETRCDLKWCPSCAHALATATVARYQKLCGEADYPLFVTWTVKNYPDPSVRPLRKAWGKLRRLRWFKRAAKGGVVGFECTQKGKGWHWHAHSLLDCEWLAVAMPKPGPRTPGPQWLARAKIACIEVAQQWELCTGRKSSIKVRKVWKTDNGDATKACMEVLKYSVKGSDLIESPVKIAPFIRLLDGTRLVTSFGTFFGKAPKEKKRPPRPCECGCREVMPEFLVPIGKKPIYGKKPVRIPGPFRS